MQAIVTAFDVKDIAKLGSSVRAQRKWLLLLFMLLLFVCFVVFGFPFGTPYQIYWLIGLVLFFSPLMVTKGYFENLTWYIYLFYTLVISGVLLASAFYLESTVGVALGALGCFVLYRGISKGLKLLRMLYPPTHLPARHVFGTVRARRVEKPIVPWLEYVRKHGLKALFVYGFAISFLLVGYIAAYRAGVHFGGLWALFIPMVFGTITLVVAVILFRIGKNTTLLGAEDILKFDKRPPVTLLRSFGDDSRSIEPTGLPLLPWNVIFTLEEVLDKVLRNYGPFLSIGDPTTGKSHAGSNRVFLSHDTWKAEASRMIQTSGVIVYLPGITEGVLWELGEIRNRDKIAKTIIVFPPEDEQQGSDQASQRWQLILKMFEGSKWQDALQACDQRTTLLIVLRENGDVAAITCADPHQDDYEMALVFGLFEVFSSTSAASAGYPRQPAPPTLRAARTP